MGILFCNIGWMSRYEGQAPDDKIVGGGGKFAGKYAEVCNFVVGDDGYVYGHVETIHGETDRKIQLERIGGSGESVSGIDVIWTATHPTEGGRRVVGWYRNATVFRERRKFDRLPSEQHERDEVTSYRIRARAEDVRRLELEERTLSMGRGKGWMGHTPGGCRRRKARRCAGLSMRFGPCLPAGPALVWQEGRGTEGKAIARPRLPIHMCDISRHTRFGSRRITMRCRDGLNGFSAIAVLPMCGRTWQA
jgi:hypothetical protein